MTTVRDICTRALRRSRVLDASSSPAAEDAATALAALNDMMHAWDASSVHIQHTDFVLSDTFFFNVPPKAADGSVIAAMTYRGAWNASTNSPALASSVGTKGYWYRVSTAGSTVLNAVTSWSVNDMAVFDGDAWLAGASSRPYEAGVIAMLTLRLCDEYAVPVPDVVVRDASLGWSAILAAWVKAPVAQFDTALTRTPSRRYYDGLS